MSTISHDADTAPTSHLAGESSSFGPDGDDETPDTRVSRRYGAFLTVRGSLLVLLAFFSTSVNAQSGTSAPSGSSGGDSHAALAALIPVLVIASGIVAGLTLGYMTFDMTQLQVLIKSGTPQQRAAAKLIEPIRRDGHLLLVTLLVANMAINEALPVIADPVLGGGVQAVLVSLALILIFSEILPQSLMTSKYGLGIAARMVWPTRVLIIILWPVAKPVAMLLTKLLGAHSGVVYRRSELKELINLHGETLHRGDLKADTVTIVGATLDLQEKTVRDAMTPMNEVFMLDLDTTRLDYPTLSKIMRTGFSRVPVFENVHVSGEEKPKKRIKGITLVKNFVLLDPEDATPLKELPIHQMPVIPDDMSLLNILNAFQEGRSHLAVVAPRLPDALKRAHTSRSDRYKPKRKATSSPDRSLFRSLFKRDEMDGDDIKMMEAGQGEARSSQASLGLPLDEDNPLGVISLEDVIEGMSHDQVVNMDLLRSHAELIGEPIADETDRTADGKVTLEPYLPLEALEAIQAQQLRHTVSTCVPDIEGPAPQPVRASRPHVAEPLPKTRSSILTSKDLTPIDSTERRGSPLSISSFGRMPKLPVTRSRSAPGRKRDALPEMTTAGTPSVGAKPLVTTPSSIDEEKLATLDETSSSESHSSDEEIDKLKKRRSLDELRTLQSVHSAQAVQAPRVPNGLANAVLLERGRRHLAAQGADLSTVNLRIAGTPTGERIAFIQSGAPASATSELSNSDRAVGPLAARRPGFKAPAPVSIPARSAMGNTVAHTKRNSDDDKEDAAPDYEDDTQRD